MKKIIIPIVIATAMFALAGCENEKTLNPLDDTDFDGLINEIDPNPRSNIYKFHINEGGQAASKQDAFVMDYREFFRNDLTTTYNPKISKLASLILNESYYTDIVIENNVYRTSSSSTSKLFTQFGCENIKYKTFLYESFNQDPNDIVDLKLGHHVVENKDKKLNVTFVEIIGYPTDLGWASNFDMGADTQAYVDTTGNHDEWLDKKNHKGFDISAKRAFDYLTNYLEENKVDDADNFVFVTGHSRSAAVASLIGKKLKDNNINSVVYAYNTPLHISDVTKEVCDSYSNIWQILNEEDFVSQIPLAAWNNFTHLGHILTYKMSEYSSKYNDYFLTRNYPTIDNDLNTKITGALNKIITSRENVYVFREPNPNYIEVILKSRNTPFDSYEEAEEAIENHYANFSNSDSIKKIIKMNITSYPEDVNKFQINYQTKPQIIVSLINDVFESGYMTTGGLISTLKAYLPFMGRYLNETSEELQYLINTAPDSFNQIEKAHQQYITFIACKLF